MAYKQRILISNCSGVWKVQHQGPEHLVSSKSLCPGTQRTVFSHGRMEMENKALWGIIYKGTNPIYEDSALLT